MKENIQLGDEVQDIITGFIGIANAKAQYMWGCDRFLVQPQLLTSEGKIDDSIWFDEPQLIIITKEKVKILREIKEKPGGPQKEPQRNPNPIRR